VNIFRFRDRVGILDERSQHFLQTVAWLGGYVTPEHAQELGIRNSVTRVHVQLKDLESWGFIKSVSAYPAIYQVTKSVTRLLGADLSARREHTLETVRTRLLTVNFYLEAIHWPVEFLLDHKQKISKLFEVVAEPEHSEEKAILKFQRRAVERMETCEDVGELARELGVRPRCLYKWRRKLEMVEPGQEASRPSTHASAHRKEIHRLKQLLAEKTLEVDFFRGVG
jgi:transposase-like protein